jgi:transposase-like protein
LADTGHLRLRLRQHTVLSRPQRRQWILRMSVHLDRSLVGSTRLVPTMPKPPTIDDRAATTGPETTLPPRQPFRATYSDEFKRDAVQRLRRRGTRGALSAVAEEIGVHPSTLSAWSRMFTDVGYTHIEEPVPWHVIEARIDTAANAAYLAAWPLLGLAWCDLCRHRLKPVEDQPIAGYGCPCRYIAATDLHTAVYRAVGRTAPRLFDASDEPRAALMTARRVLLAVTVRRTPFDLGLRWRPEPLPASSAGLSSIVSGWMP